MRRKVLSLLLALCMIVTIVPASALAVGETSSGVGEINVTVKQMLSNSNITFKASVDGNQEIDLQKDADSTTMTGRFTGLTAGDHTIAISAPKYLTYTQTVTVRANQGVGITVYDDASVNVVDEVSDPDKNYGVIAFGDVNGDGQINDDDAQEVTQGINNDKIGDYDLNGDGEEDLADLSYVVRSTKQVNAIPIYTISNNTLQETVKAEVSQSTNVSFGSTTNGKVPETIEEALFSENATGYVELKPANNGTISATNPIEVTLAVQQDLPPVEAITIEPPFNSQNTITSGTIVVEGTEKDTGNTVTIEVPVEAKKAETIRNKSTLGKVGDIFSMTMGADSSSTVERSGTVVINLGKKVAIKKISIKVTGTSSGTLADIAKVEFLEDFASRIPEPQLSIPEINPSTISHTDGEHKSLTFSWSRQDNITGYELSILGSGVNVMRSTTNTTYTFQSDDFTKLLAYTPYTLKVRSISGDWRSDWSAPVEYEIKPKVAPPTPEYLAAKPGAGFLDLSWRDLWDTKSWSVFYKEKSASSYTEINNITKNSYRLDNLKSGVTYEFYVVAHNDVGSSSNSVTAEGTPIAATGVKMPEYKVINDRSNRMKGISSLNGKSDKSYTIYKSDGSSVTNATATAEDWKAIADNNPNSYLYIGDWDSGYDWANFRGPVIQLTQAYEIDTIRMSPKEGSGLHISKARIVYHDANDSNTEKTVETQVYNTKKDSQGLSYYEIRFANPIKTDYMELKLSTGYTREMTIAELRLYEYDSLEHDVRALFTDGNRTHLKSNVTAKTIEELKARANAVDPASEETHPNKETILTDLAYAEALLTNAATMDEPIVISNQVTAAADGSTNSHFALPLSDLQPLGYVGTSLQQAILYVSSKDGNIGDTTSLKLVMAQYHPEVSSWQKEIENLKIGRNEITLPKLTDVTQEKGGALYVYYAGNKGDKQYTVRVLQNENVRRIPVLHVEGLTGTERTNAIKSYVEKLKIYAAVSGEGSDSEIKKLHDQLHNLEGITQYEYDDGKNCILNSTEIVMNNMFFSFPATQVWRAISDAEGGSGDISACATKLEKAIEAMEQEIDLFYQFKGFNKNEPDSSIDRYPTKRLNIRYHKMFTGAFMYAGGKHIGIEWDSVGGLFNTTPFDPDTGQGGSYSGWGIGHEIGHVINTGSYTVVEVTNNVFAQLAKSATEGETTANFRTTYDKVYDAVIAGNTGHTGDLGVQLAMFWQLHLAYDNQKACKIYNTITEQKQNLFYARVDSYLRDKSQAPGNLTLDGSKDDNFMRVCCAAAQKNLLDFFRAWGFTPDANTVAYASQFDKETRKIQYIDDDSRLYRMNNSGNGSKGATVNATINNNNGYVNTNKVTLQLSTSADFNDILGYEIIRRDVVSNVAGSPVDKNKVVGFANVHSKNNTTQSANIEFTDIVATENNKAFTYTVNVIDRLMNVVATTTLAEVKVKHDGSIDKTGWTATTNMTSDADSIVESNSNDPDSYVLPQGSYNPSGAAERKQSVIGRVIDNNSDMTNSVYTGKVASGNPEIVLNMGGTQQVTALKYTPGGSSPIGAYTIYISADGNSWTEVKKGTFDINSPEPQTVYFNVEGNSWMYTYDADYVKLVATGQKEVSLAELDVLGPTNDDVELKEMGTLSETYVYDSKGQSIPAGSIVFYGTYKGDPSYNLVILKDQDGKVINGEQIVLAEVPESGELGQTSDGAWIYWLETDEQKAQMANISKVQAELYRVQDAEQLTGERLTSTSLHLTKPDPLPSISLTSENLNNPLKDGSAAQTVSLQGYSPKVSMQNLVSAQPSSNRSMQVGADANLRTVQLTDNGANGVNFTVIPDELSIAMQTTIDIDTVPQSVNVTWTKDNNVFQTYYYDNSNSILYLYSVARTGMLKSVSGSVSAPFADKINFEATELALLNSGHGIEKSDGSGQKVTLYKNLNVPIACLRDSSCPLSKFTDISSTDWYHDGVHFMLENKYMIGMSDTSFAQGINVTRAMVAQILYAKAGRPKVNATSSKFSDVETNWWYTDAITWAAQKNVVTGYPDGTFKPNDSITRQDLAVMLHSAAGDPKIDASLANYPDQAKVGEWAIDALKWAISYGIITGNLSNDGTLLLDPTGNATRAQTAIMIMQYFCLPTV